MQYDWPSIGQREVLAIVMIIRLKRREHVQIFHMTRQSTGWQSRIMLRK